MYSGNVFSFLTLPLKYANMNKTFWKALLKWLGRTSSRFISLISDCSADRFLCFYFSTAKPRWETCQALSRGFPPWSVHLLSCSHAGCQNKLNWWKWIAGRCPDFLCTPPMFLYGCMGDCCALGWRHQVEPWLAQDKLSHRTSAALWPTHVKQTPATAWFGRCANYVSERIVPNHLIFQACPEGLSYHMPKRRCSALTASIKLLIRRRERPGDCCRTGKKKPKSLFFSPGINIHISLPHPERCGSAVVGCRPGS